MICRKLFSLSFEPYETIIQPYLIYHFQKQQAIYLPQNSRAVLNKQTPSMPWLNIPKHLILPLSIRIHLLLQLTTNLIAIHPTRLRIPRISYAHLLPIKGVLILMDDLLVEAKAFIVAAGTDAGHDEDIFGAAWRGGDDIDAGLLRREWQAGAPVRVGEDAGVADEVGGRGAVADIAGEGVDCEGGKGEGEQGEEVGGLHSRLLGGVFLSGKVSLR